MEAACRRLLHVRGPGDLICPTDAGTAVAPDWLAAHLQAVGRGPEAIGGRIDLADAGTLPPGVLHRHAENSRLRYQRLLSDPKRVGRKEHWQFSDASRSLTAKTYRKMGSLRPMEDLEDEHLEEVLSENGVPIERLLSIRVTTSPRLKCRASRGLSHDLTHAALTNSARAPG